MVIPDPEQPERLALDGDGNLLGGCRIRRITTPEAPSIDDLDEPAWEWVGWARIKNLGDGENE
jgi:hypothetical protein